MWCLTKGHALSCGASLSALPGGVVPHYRPCLLALYLTISHACWSIATATDILLVECRWKKDGVWCNLYSGAIISDKSANMVPFSDMLVQCNSIRHACWVHLFRYACSGKVSGRLQMHQTCPQVGLCSNVFVKLISYHPGRHLEYIKF